MARRTKKEIQEISKEVKNGIKRFVRYQEGADLYSMGLHTFQQLSKEAGAVYKIGKKVLIRRSIFEAYLREQRKI